MCLINISPHTCNHFSIILCGCFRTAWLAPEQYRDLRTLTIYTDRYSYGVCLWEIFSLGQRPYEGLSHDKVRVLIHVSDFSILSICRTLLWGNKWHVAVWWILFCVAPNPFYWILNENMFKPVGGVVSKHSDQGFIKVQGSSNSISTFCKLLIWCPLPRCFIRMDGCQ